MKTTHSLRRVTSAFFRASSLTLILTLAAVHVGESAELIVLAPMTAGGKAVTRAGPKGEQPSPIFKRAQADAVTKAIAAEATRGTTKFMLTLDEQAQRINGATAPAPTYLLRSSVDGGFARRGFWLADANNNPVWRADPYVDLIVDKAGIDDGSFEELFAHEMGHVLLRRLIPRLPNGLSRTPHSSLAVTDYPTAFDEGFAIHFQGLARQLTQNNRLKALDKGLDFKPFIPFWQSNIERSIRLRGIRENLFVHRQLPSMLGVGDATTQFDLGQLKSGQQMMASEGVIATLFYHLMIRPTDTAPALTERYKSLLITLRSLNGQRIPSSQPVILNLVQAHGQRVPSERPRWIATVLELTYGATTSSSVTRDLNKLSTLGQEGKSDEFSAGLKQSRSALATLTEQITRNPQRLGAAVGPELWLAFKDGDKNEVTLNLNSAEKASLMNALQLEDMDADLLIADRASRGPFVSVEEFATRRKAPPLLRQRLQEAHDLAATLGGYSRE